MAEAATTEATEPSADAPPTNPLIARNIDETHEAAREVQRTRQIAVAGGVGLVSLDQLMQQLRELMHFYLPSQPELLWQFLTGALMLFFGGWMMHIIRRNEL